MLDPNFKLQMQIGPDRKLNGRTYAQWILSLKPGDPVRIRHPWEDASEPGGRRDKGFVESVNDAKSAAWRVTVRYHHASMGTDRTVTFYEQGNSSESWLDHPDVVAFTSPDNLPDQGMEFLTGMEVLAHHAYRQKPDDTITPKTQVQSQHIPSDWCTPNWNDAGYRFEWKRYISQPLREIWDTFNDLQKVVIAAAAEESASNEDADFERDE
jgi:hypothetical protein